MSHRILFGMILSLLLTACMSEKNHLEQLNDMKNESRYDNSIDHSNQDLNMKLRNIEAAYRDLEQRLEREIANRQVSLNRGAGYVVSLSLSQSVLFSSGSEKLSQQGRDVLDKIANMLLTLPQGQAIRIVGHSDNVPIGGVLRNKYTDNWDLSATRAAEVARFFIWGHRIPQERFRIEGRAHTNPIANNNTAEGRQKNRRIEIFIEH